MSGIGKVRKEIGANVRSFRTRAGLSQEKLGEKADLHPVYISQVERGAKAGNPPKRVICGVQRSFPGSCASEAKARLNQQSDALLLPGSLSSISQTDAGGRGESWESRRAFMGYSGERPHPPPDPILLAGLTADGRQAAFLCLRFRPEAERRTSNLEP